MNSKELEDLDRRLENIEKLCRETLEIFGEELSSNFSSIGDDINDRERLESKVAEIESVRQKIQKGSIPNRASVMRDIEDGAVSIISHVLKEEAQAINQEYEDLSQG